MDKHLKLFLILSIPLAHVIGWCWGWWMSIDKGIAELTVWMGIGLVPFIAFIFILCIVISIASKEARIPSALFALIILSFASGVFFPLWLYGLS